MIKLTFLSIKPSEIARNFLTYPSIIRVKAVLLPVVCTSGIIALSATIKLISVQLIYRTWVSRKAVCHTHIWPTYTVYVKKRVSL
jgi:hypothetical protein